MAIDTVYKQRVAIPLEKKGNRDPFASRILAAFARYVGHPRVIIQGDSEHALMAVIHDACALLTAATPRTSLVNSKGSNGAAERAVQSVEGMARTLRLDFVNTTPQMTRFRGAKVCSKWLQERIDDHNIQSENKNKVDQK